MNSRIHRTLQQFAEFLLRHPIFVFGGLLLSAFVSLFLARDLKFDFSPQSIYRGNAEMIAYAEEFKKTFGYDDAVLLILLQATGEKDVLSATALQWQAETVKELQSHSDVVRIDSVATIEAPQFSVLGATLHPLIEQTPVSDEAAEGLREILRDSKLVRSGMLSADDRVATIAVFLDPNSRDIDGLKAIVKRVDEALHRNPPPESFQYFLSGLPAMRVQIVEDLARDMATLIPVGGVVYLIVLSFIFRRLSGAILPLCAVGIGLTWTLATFAVTGDSLNLVSNVLPVLLMIIGVSSCVQIVTCYAEESNSGLDRRTAARESIAKMAAPCFLAAVTTAVGFASLFTARSELLNQFGWQAAVGIGFQYVSTILTLGSLFRFFPAPTYVGTNEIGSTLLTRIVTILGYAVARHARIALACAAIIVGLAVWSGSQVKINTNAFSETFSESHPIVRTLRLIESELSGVMQLEVSLTADKPETLLKPEVFHQIVKFEELARKYDGTLDVQSYVDLYREILQSWPGRQSTETDLELVPLSETGQIRLGRTDQFIERFADAFHYRSYLSSDGKRCRIRIRMREIGSREMLNTIESFEKDLSRLFPSGGEIVARVTGEAYVNAMALTILIRDLFYSLLTASLVIFALIAFEFRSFRVGMIAALPNLTPLAITLGYMGLRGCDMNVANVIVFTICLGLADDNTIYFLYRFRQEMESGGSTLAAVRRTLLGTGRAIVLTSLLLLVGMSVLFCSDFVPTQRFAELTSITIAGNLLGVLLLLPACLVLFWKRSPVGRLKSPDHIDGTDENRLPENVP